MKFTAADIPQFNSFSALYDAYRIEKLKVQFVPVVSTYNVLGNAASNLTAQPQWLSTVVDYDDQTLLTTEGALMDYETFKESAPYERHTREFKPAVSLQAYKTSGTTIGYSQHKDQWIDAAYSDVEHYGIKGLINGPASMAAQVQTAWKVYVSVQIAWKQVR